MMTQNISIDVDKLISPIEELGLKQRAYHSLMRAGIRQISDIIVIGEVKIMSIRNIGSLIGEYIISETAGFLGISKDALFSVDPIKLIMEEKDKSNRPLYDPIELLNLSPVIISLLKQAGIECVTDLIASSDLQYGNLKKIDNANFRNRVLRELDKQLLVYLTSRRDEDDASNKEISKVSNYEDKSVEVSSLTGGKKLNYLVGTPPVATKQIEKLVWVLDSLGMSNRIWLVIELKANRLLSHKEIAAEIGGVTRARIYQIIDRVLENVKANLKSLSVFFDFFEKKAIEIRSELLSDTFTIDTLVEHLNKNLIYEYLYATNEDVVKLITLIRVLVMHRKPWVSEIIEANWGNIVFLSCLVDPIIEIDGGARQRVERQKQKKREISYKELAISVLNESSRPMHWSEIAKQAERLGNRHNFETGGFYHALSSHEDIFVRVGKGTYELAEWGSKTVEPYPEIIASILSRENRTIPFEVILARASTIRSVKQSSLFMSLELHPRFYKSINNTYGLRGWLPPREKQNLRTPEWLIEDSNSLERVERAKAKGYDIESLIANDKLQ